MTKDTFLITIAPQQLRDLHGWRVTPAHLAYRVGRGAHLLRAGEVAPLKGGVMVLDNRGFDGLGAIAPFCREVERECLARGFSGAVLDFEGRLPPLMQMVGQLDGLFAAHGWTLYVPEGYGSCAPNARVMIPSTISGGSLHLRLEEAVTRFGCSRTALALERAAEDFFLPSPTGGGLPLTREQLEQQIAKLRPSIFFSSELCARYYTYMNRDTGAHFVLFDDGDTMRHKLEVARHVGISNFLAPWPDVKEYAELLGLSRLPPQQAQQKKGR